MGEFLRNLLVGVIGIAATVAMITVGLFAGLILIGAGLIFWIVLALRRRQILKSMSDMPQSPYAEAEPGLIVDADYEVVGESQEQERKDRV